MDISSFKLRKTNAESCGLQFSKDSDSENEYFIFNDNEYLTTDVTMTMVLNQIEAKISLEEIQCLVDQFLKPVSTKLQGMPRISKTQIDSIIDSGDCIPAQLPAENARFQTI